jgi:Holliday junction resolvase RusA-like endonuclease
MNIPPTQNELRRMHYQTIAKEKKSWERIIWAIVKEQKIQPVNTVLVTYEFWFKDRRRRDADNYAASAKMLQDGLVKAGILPDDNFEYVKELRIKHGGVSDKPYILIHLDEIA